MYMNTLRRSDMKIWINIAIVLVVFVLFFQLNSCWSNPDIVSEEHFVRVKPLLDDIAKKAKNIPIKTGHTISRNIKKSRGVPGRSTVRTRIIRDDQNRTFIIFNMGGGLLGQQGYIYSEDSNISISNVEGMPLEESYVIQKIQDQWWSYDSTED